MKTIGFLIRFAAVVFIIALGMVIGLLMMLVGAA